MKLVLGFSPKLTSSRALMVEEDTVACIDTIRLPVVNHNPVGIQLGSTWRKHKIFLFSCKLTNSNVAGSHRRVSGGRMALSLSEEFLELCQTVHWLRPTTRKDMSHERQPRLTRLIQLVILSTEYFLFVTLVH